MAVASRSALSIFVLLLTLSSAQGLQVFLTNMTVFIKHRLNFEGDLRVYFQCDGQDRVHLPDITIEGHPYAWPTEDLLLTTITKGSCKTCGFFEDRLLPFVRDDPFGAPFPLCESDFSGPDSRDSLVRWLAETQFDATMYCPDCKVASPPPPPDQVLPQAPQATKEALTSESSRPTQAARWWQRTGAIVGMSVSAALVLGLAAGAVAYSLYKHGQARKEENRAKAFERVFNDPDVDLEEVAAQDAKSAGFLAFGRKAWTRLRDTQVSTDV
ncbi:g11216 [Coccomyxa viridis]|uniref:G11216 protein n=1 Tax=Coccomyxa viridis TaxID=1274662 RepID=A0ABP1GA13_9CHLO